MSIILSHVFANEPSQPRQFVGLPHLPTMVTTANPSTQAHDSDKRRKNSIERAKVVHVCSNPLIHDSLADPFAS